MQKDCVKHIVFELVSKYVTFQEQTPQNESLKKPTFKKNSTVTGKSLKLTDAK